MAGTIVVDRIESDASYASNINVASQITFSNTVNFGITSVAPVAGFYSPSTNNVAFTTASTERMRINPSGNVGIGTSSPSQKLDVSGEAQLTYAGGTNYLYFISTSNYVGRNSTGDMWLNVTGAQNIIYGIGGTEKMRLTQNGFLCINKTTTQYSESLSIGTSNNQGIHINDTASSSSINYQYFTKGGSFTNVGALYYNGSVMAYQTTSDYRLKENVTPLTNALNKIALLNPVTYTWKDNQQSGEGFLAHELQEHFPDAVSGTKDEVDDNGNPKYQGMDASVLIATMVKSIQELKAINDTQAATITALTARVVALES